MKRPFAINTFIGTVLGIIGGYLLAQGIIDANILHITLGYQQ